MICWQKDWMGDFWVTTRTERHRKFPKFLQETCQYIIILERTQLSLCKINYALINYFMNSLRGLENLRWILNTDSFIFALCILEYCYFFDNADACQKMLNCSASTKFNRLLPKLYDLLFKRIGLKQSAMFSTKSNFLKDIVLSHYWIFVDDKTSFMLRLWGNH